MINMFPTNCPICGDLLEENGNIFTCNSKEYQISFYKARDIKNITFNIIEEFIKISDGLAISNLLNTNGEASCSIVSYEGQFLIAENRIEYNENISKYIEKKIKTIKTFM